MDLFRHLARSSHTISSLELIKFLFADDDLIFSSCDIDVEKFGFHERVIVQFGP